MPAYFLKHHLIYFDSTPPENTLKTVSKAYTVSITVILLKLSFVQVRQSKLINSVSLRVAKTWSYSKSHQVTCHFHHSIQEERQSALK
jgi:hypothetical protein